MFFYLQINVFNIYALDRVETCLFHDHDRRRALRERVCDKQTWDAFQSSRLSGARLRSRL